jgi:putative ABC transport system permease protein
MWRIALKMLMGDTAKFCGILLGLTFAALLIMRQGAIFCGLMKRTAGQINDISGVDLWVMDPKDRHRLFWRRWVPCPCYAERW